MEVPEITRKLLHRHNATKIHRLNHTTAEAIADALLNEFYVGRITGPYTAKDAHKSDLVAAILAASAKR